MLGAIFGAYRPASARPSLRLLAPLALGSADYRDGTRARRKPRVLLR